MAKRVSKCYPYGLCWSDVWIRRGVMLKKIDVRNHESSCFQNERYLNLITSSYWCPTNFTCVREMEWPADAEYWWLIIVQMDTVREWTLHEFDVLSYYLC